LIVFEAACVFFVSGDANAMDCADIVIGAAIGRLSRVKDYYTPDRSTPKQDQFYGGTQSITAAIASEDSDTGITTLIFRRPLMGQLLSSDSSSSSSSPTSLPSNQQCQSTQQNYVINAIELADRLKQMV